MFCVVRVDGVHYAYVVTPTGTEERVVEIGSDNNEMIQVVSGLTVGEEVVLAPPLLDMSLVRKAGRQGLVADRGERPEPNAASAFGG